MKKCLMVLMVSLLVITLADYTPPFYTQGALQIQSKFFRDIPEAQDIISGKLSDYSILEFNLLTGGANVIPIRGKVNTFAFRVLSALRQLGYNGFNWVPDGRPGLALFNRFQEDHGLAVTHLVTKEALLKLDQLLVQRELSNARIAKQLSIYNDIIEGPNNFPSRDHVAALYYQTINALPDFFQLKDRDTLLHIAEFFYPRRAFPVDPWWPKILDRYYYDYSWITPPVELGRIPDDFRVASTLLHEIGHFIESESYIGGVVRPPLVDTTSFYEISWEQVKEEGFTYWKPKKETNFATDFVSGYAGAELGYQIDAGIYNPRAYPREREDFAESFSLYVLQGTVFRDKAKESKILEKKYLWLKDNVFKGYEYQTGSATWKSSFFSPTPVGRGIGPGGIVTAIIAKDVAANVPFYSSYDPSFIWDYEFPFSVTFTATEPLPTITASVSPTSIVRGDSAILTWTSTNTTSVSISGIGVVPVSGSTSVSPTTTTAYTFIATGPGGTASASVTLTVTEPPPPPLLYRTVELRIGSTMYKVDGITNTMDAAPYIEESRTMVPVRFFSRRLRWYGRLG
ncbi:MAG: hypothetical protein DDT19_02964 [Syntrophomonadaceae bacterium]|nr:hypothetical protein [Bacillota bacterium]